MIAHMNYCNLDYSIGDLVVLQINIVFANATPKQFKMAIWLALKKQHGNFNLSNAFCFPKLEVIVDDVVKKNLEKISSSFLLAEVNPEVNITMLIKIINSHGKSDFVVYVVVPRKNAPANYLHLVRYVNSKKKNLNLFFF